MMRTGGYQGELVDFLRNLSPEERFSFKWQLADGTYLLETIWGDKTFLYYVFDPSSREAKVIVGLSSNSVIRHLDKERVEFLSRSRNDTPATTFPYLSVYDIKSRRVEEPPVFLSINTTVAFGGINKNLLLDQVISSGNHVTITFKQLGPVGGMPRVNTKFAEETREFVVEYPGLNSGSEDELRTIQVDSPMIRRILIRRNEHGMALQITLKEVNGVTYRFKEAFEPHLSLSLEFSTTTNPTSIEIDNTFRDPQNPAMKPPR